MHSLMHMRKADFKYHGISIITEDVDRECGQWLYSGHGESWINYTGKK